VRTHIYGNRKKRLRRAAGRDMRYTIVQVIY
jgi:hypothetical protein